MFRMMCESVPAGGRRLLLFGLAMFSVLLAVRSAPAVHAQVPDTNTYVEYVVGSTTATYQQPSLKSPQVGTIQAGETIYGSPGPVLGEDAVVFLRCRRPSGQDLGYCPLYGPGFSNNLTAVTTGARLVLPQFTNLVPTVVTPGLVAPVCNAFGQCVTPVCNAFGQCFTTTPSVIIPTLGVPRGVIILDR
jgi:hypothetical protein